MPCSSARPATAWASCWRSIGCRRRRASPWGCWPSAGWPSWSGAASSAGPGRAFGAGGWGGGGEGMGMHWPATLFGYSQSALLKPATVFLIAWVSMVLTTVLLLFLLRTRFGAITEAIRDNEERARFIGIGTTAPRAAVYALSAVVAGIAGILSALNTGFVSPENLHWSVSAITLLMVVVGGFEKLAGPIIGAIVYVMSKDLLGGYATHSMALFGAALIAVIVFSPHGIAGALERLCIRLRRGPGVRRKSV